MPDLTCTTCGAELERKPGPGRPPSYCGETCRRLAEWEIRRLHKRLDGYEIELREVVSGSNNFGHFSEDGRAWRIRSLRKWIKADRERLAVLFGQTKH